MATTAAAGQGQPSWVSALLGVFFIIMGFIVLGDVLAASVITAFFIGVCAIVAGGFEIAHAIWTKGWGGFIWHIILGLLYIAGGFVLVTQPVAGALALTWVLGLFILASGIVRIFVGFQNMARFGWLLIISGIFGIIAGVIVLSGWPATGLWVIGFLLGVDLVMHGVGWLVLAFSSKPKLA